jgi:fatty-acid peroxygenase
MDSAFGVLFTGYPYFLNKFRKQRRDILKIRLLFMKAIAMRGEEAARLFYNEEKFIRKGAMPKRVQKTLIGSGGVQVLDDAAHKQRKEMFMAIMGEASLSRLEQLFSHHWRECQKHWEHKKEICLFKEAEKVLCRAACEWVGISLPEEDVQMRTKQLSALIDSPAALGPKHIKGRFARKRVEAWVMGLVTDVRKDKSVTDENSVLYRFSHQRELTGELLDKRIVAVEIINLIRPIVAIARYITFAALALHEHPEYSEKLKDNQELQEQFVHEVRRYYPFFPFVAARVRQTFKHRGIKFKRGRMVLLDIYATNHHEKAWKDPGRFYPERFADWDGSPFNFIPQGGGNHNAHHRCAGEWITIRLTKAALVLLNENMEYNVPEQDLTIDMNRIPAIPRSRFRIKPVALKLDEVLLL